MNSFNFENSSIASFGYGSELSLNKEFISKYRKLNKDIKKSLRIIVFQDDGNKTNVVNKFRKTKSPQEVSDFEEVALLSNNNIIPKLYPKEPQIYNYEYFLDNLLIEKQISILNITTGKQIFKLLRLVDMILELNKFIIKEDYEKAQSCIENIVEDYGYSHFIIRKMILINELNKNGDVNLDYIDKEIQSYNSSGENIII